MVLYDPLEELFYDSLLDDLLLKEATRRDIMRRLRPYLPYVAGGVAGLGGGLGAGLLAQRLLAPRARLLGRPRIGLARSILPLLAALIIGGGLGIGGYLGARRLV